MRRTAALLVVFVFLVVPASLMAQDEEMKPITWVRFMKAKPGMTMDFVQLLMEHDQPIFDKLMEEGHLLSWGIAVPLTQKAGSSWNTVVWLTTTGWADYDHLMAAFEEAEKARGEDANKELEEEWKAAYEDGSADDTILRHLVLHVPGEGDERAQPLYIGMGFWKAKPGQGSGATAVYKRVGEPVMAGLVEEGKLYSAGLAVQESHAHSEWTHCSWYFMENMSAMDSLSAAFAASEQGRSEEEAASLEARFKEVFEDDSHYDQLLRIIHFAN